MKLLLGLCAFLSLGAFAQNTVVLDSPQARLDTNAVVLEKIDLTPDVVELLVPVPTVIQMCDPRDQRTVTGTNGAECGYRLVTSGCGYYGPRHPRGGYGPRHPRGPRYNPPGRRGPRRGTVGRRGPRRGGVIVRSAPRCVPVTRSVPRTCTYTVCERPYTVTEDRMKRFTVDFSEYNRDEAFDFSLNQNGDVTLLPIVTSPGCTSLVTYGERPNVTGAKISLKTGWFNRNCR